MTETNNNSPYQPLVAVWEITMNCNLRCKHCGSSCTGPLPDELSTEEAFGVCDGLGRLGLKRITLSGGEPFSRPDWPLIVQRLTKNNIKTNMLSNGWFIDRDTVKRAADAGVVNIGISVDGTEETHDYIRKEGSFAHIMKALDVMRDMNMPAGIVTSIHKKNIHQLPEIKEILIEKGVRDWQLQAAMPMGNLMQHLDWIANPEDIDDVIDFAYESMKEGRIRVHLSDDMGYFNLKEIEIRKNAQKSPYALGIWKGCPAGKHSLGVRCTGDIIGCLSIREDKYIEGNVRETSLEELWNRPGAFAWNRELTKEKLTGFCKTCQFGGYCKAGCTTNKLTRHNCITENEFCSYWSAVDKERQKINAVDDFKQLAAKGRELAQKGDLQGAGLHIDRALELQPDNVEMANLSGYVHFFMDNFQESEAANRRALEIEPGNAYSMKGLGLALAKQGRVAEGIDMLKKAVEHAPENFMDPFHDLAVTLMDDNRPDEALTVLEDGRNRSEAFKEKSEEFYRRVKEKVNNASV
jgi:radical SAM protein with 4Fe4S-binding SPASM domain